MTIPGSVRSVFCCAIGEQNRTLRHDLTCGPQQDACQSGFSGCSRRGYVKVNEWYTLRAKRVSVAHQMHEVEQHFQSKSWGEQGTRPTVRGKPGRFSFAVRDR